MTTERTTSDAVDPGAVSRPDPGTGSPVPDTGWNAREFFYRYTVILVLALMIIVFSLLRPSTFFTTGNFTSIANSEAILLMLALGLTLPLVVGEFDLSVASGLGFGAVLIGFLTGGKHWGLAPSVLVVLLVGAGVGVVNGLFVVHFRVNAFIVTLGTGTVLTGLTLAVSGGQILSGIPSSLIRFSTIQFSGLTIPVFMALALVILLWYVYDFTPLGRYLTFVGLGREVARLAGLPVDALRWGTLIGSSVIAAGCGVLAAGQLGAADPSGGAAFLLPAYAAAFLGTTTIRPGRFNAWGTVVALALLVVGVTGLQLLGAASWVEQVFNGGALIIAVTIAQLVSRKEQL